MRIDDCTILDIWRLLGAGTREQAESTLHLLQISTFEDTEQIPTAVWRMYTELGCELARLKLEEPNQALHLLPIPERYQGIFSKLE